MSGDTERFFWLKYLARVADRIVKVLFEKEQHYEGSWQKRGGVGAMMMLLRKADRIESIAKRNGYNIFVALDKNDGDIKDDIEDLVGYLLLVLAYHEAIQADRKKAIVKSEHGVSSAEPEGPES